jgi:hypothetical protein
MNADYEWRSCAYVEAIVDYFKVHQHLHGVTNEKKNVGGTASGWRIDPCTLRKWTNVPTTQSRRLKMRTFLCKSARRVRFTQGQQYANKLVHCWNRQAASPGHTQISVQQCEPPVAPPARCNLCIWNRQTLINITPTVAMMVRWAHRLITCCHEICKHVKMQRVPCLIENYCISIAHESSRYLKGNSCSQWRLQLKCLVIAFPNSDEPIKGRRVSTIHKRH